MLLELVAPALGILGDSCIAGGKLDAIIAETFTVTLIIHTLEFSFEFYKMVGLNLVEWNTNLCVVGTLE